VGAPLTSTSASRGENANCPRGPLNRSGLIYESIDVINQSIGFPSGTWWEAGGVRRSVSQFHEVVGHVADQLGGNKFGTFVRVSGQVCAWSQQRT